jgi:hypothetical protein
VGRLADRLAALTASVMSPDGNLQARSKGGELADLSIGPGAYERYTERDLEHQLARTATLLYVAHDRGVQQAMDDAGLHRATEPLQARDESQRRFLEATQKIAVEGSGPRGLVRFEIAGMANWRCRIADGALGQLTEQEFIAEAAEAARDLLRRNQYEKAMLKTEFFGTRQASDVRERARRFAEHYRASRLDRG